MECIKAAESILVVDTTLEEAKEAKGGYIKVSIKDIDSSAATNPQLQVKS